MKDWLQLPSNLICLILIWYQSQLVFNFFHSSQNITLIYYIHSSLVKIILVISPIKVLGFTGCILFSYFVITLKCQYWLHVSIQSILVLSDMSLLICTRERCQVTAVCTQMFYSVIAWTFLLTSYLNATKLTSVCLNNKTKNCSVTNNHRRTVNLV